MTSNVFKRSKSMFRLEIPIYILYSKQLRHIILHAKYSVLPGQYNITHNATLSKIRW